ncbi:bacterial DNA-binding domain protein [Xanthomonas citri pv. mangiferaeindicae LMG 941]|nr:bacterial DNA-binding domain protein [Xanthomonas citri pv. mangiferaeindicae LMG 941]
MQGNTKPKAAYRPETAPFPYMERAPTFAIDGSHLDGAWFCSMHPRKVGLIGSLRRPTDARCGRCPRKRSAAVRQTSSERAHGAGKQMRFVRFFCRW